MLLSTPKAPYSKKKTKPKFRDKTSDPGRQTTDTKSITVLVMNGGLSESQTRRSSSQETPLHVVASTGTECPQSHLQQFPSNGRLSRDATPVPARKRQLDETSKSDLLPSKRTKLTRDVPEPGAEDTKAEQADKALHQPWPKPPKRPYACLLGDCVDPVDPDPSPEPINTFVAEWLDFVGSDREIRCRSESRLRHSDDGPIPRNLIRSAPEMAYARDADGFAVPPTPNSYAGSAAPSDLTGVTTDSARSSGRSLVEDPLYRSLNLASNSIYMRPLREQFPEHIADLVDYVRRDRDSPSPSPDQVRQDTDLEALELGTGEPEVEEYFRNNIYPYPNPREHLKRSDRQPMSRHTVPNSGSKLRVSNPVPDMLYGCNRHEAFPQQQAQLISMGDTVVANTQDLLCPFFVIEFKGDGPGGGGTMWVATNQCLGGSASCINIAERLNRQLKECQNGTIKSINSATFGIAMSGTEARLYVSWKHNELDYYTRKVKSFLLQEPEHYLEFRKYVRNIIDWGKDRRLNEIRDSLDALLEESRKRTSEATNSCQPPSATSRGKRHKSSSSRRNRSRSKSVQEDTKSANEPYWELDEVTKQLFHRHADGTVTWAEQGG